LQSYVRRNRTVLLGGWLLAFARAFLAGFLLLAAAQRRHPSMMVMVLALVRALRRRLIRKRIRFAATGCLRRLSRFAGSVSGTAREQDGQRQQAAEAEHKRGKTALDGVGSRIICKRLARSSPAQKSDNTAPINRDRTAEMRRLA